uniref:Uncharacterized protein n=1 Tax=Nicotiana tabacum TaxID=4097 RepID=A0A1S3YBK3_TOBAC|nr:PREDICTED: uncharacterized protein LOC107774551 [Nicotiana tabacum]
MMHGTDPAAASTSSQIHQELRQKINALLQQIHVAEEKLSMCEPDPMKMTSMEEVEACEKQLESLLHSVLQRKVAGISDVAIASTNLAIIAKCIGEVPKRRQEKEESEAVLLAYDNALNQPQFFDSSVICGTSERNNLSTVVVPPHSQGSSSSLNVESSEKMPWQYHFG